MINGKDFKAKLIILFTISMAEELIGLWRKENESSYW